MVMRPRLQELVFHIDSDFKWLQSQVQVMISQKKPDCSLESHIAAIEVSIQSNPPSLTYNAVSTETNSYPYISGALERHLSSSSRDDTGSFHGASSDEEGGLSVRRDPVV